MFPTIFHFIHTYGLMLAIAFLTGIWWVSREGKKEGISPDQVMDLGLWVLFAAVLGSRVAYVLPHWNEFAAQPWTVLAVWEGGLTFYGGVLLAVSVGFWFIWKSHLPIWRTADLIAPAFAMGIAIGRIGCFLNGCCFGNPTVLPWGLSFPENCPAGYQWGETARLHPTQVYESLVGVVLFLILLWLRRTQRYEGFLFWSFALLYALWRLFSDSLRYYDIQSVLVWGKREIPESQLISLALSVISAAFLIALWVRSRKRSKSRKS